MTSLIIAELQDATIRKTDDGRFSVYDLIRVAGGKKNPHDAWKRLCAAHPELITGCEFYKFPGRGNHNTPVVSKDFIETHMGLFIQKGILISDRKQIKTSDKHYPRTESQIARVLVAAFYDQEPCTQFFCQGYRIDIYLSKPRIAIECDENGHKDYAKKEEQKRERAIKSALGCSFVRFDPYCDNFNLGDVIAKIRELI